MKRFTLILLVCLLVLAGCQGAPEAAPFSLQATATEPPAVSAEPLYIVEPQDAYRVFYEIFVGSFYDSNGDGIGDLAGVLKKLDYINDARANSNESLHATGVWLMPVMPSPTYHKYDTTDYYSIDPAYGTLSDFEALAVECQRRGISLIIDLVLNHTSNEHPWFLSALESMRAGECGASEASQCEYALSCRKHNKYCSYYNFSDTVLSGYHPVSGVNGLYYEGQFWSGMPDLNLDEPMVREEILSICKFWLDKGASGFRLDAVTSYYTGNTAKNTELLSWLTKELKAYKSDVYLVGEAWTDEGAILKLYESGIDSLFNFPFAQSSGDIVDALRHLNGEKLARKAQTWQESISAASPQSIDAPFLTNHDMTRSAGMLMRDPAKIKLAAAVYMLLPGNPFIYYGEEIGMTGGSDNDPNKRAPMQWAASGGEGFTAYPDGTTKKEPPDAGVAEQLADESSILRYYIDLINIRNQEPALARGRLTAIATGVRCVMAYKVEYAGVTRYVLHNLGAQEARVDANLFNGASVLHTLGANGEAAYLADGNAVLPVGATLILG